MNNAPDKKKAPEKIDDFAALLMGIGAGQVEKPPAPKHQLIII
jgi:hypothetical protein